MEYFVERYLERINYQGGTAATLPTLQALQRYHLLSIPFENLDIHLQRLITLDVEKIYTKIVEGKRGGFCYELNGLFYELLNRLGFQVKRIAASVYDKEKRYGLAYDHLCLLVTISGVEYLTDVGFGSFIYEPLRLQIGLKQEDQQGLFIIEKTEEKYFRVSKKNQKEWVPQYIFQTKARDYKEFEPMCHYHQTSPESHFTHKRLISLLKPNGRVTITGNTLKLDKNGLVSEQPFEEEAFYILLKRYFCVEI